MKSSYNNLTAISQIPFFVPAACTC